MAISEGAKFDHDRMLTQNALHFQYVHVLRARDYSDFALAANDRFNGLRRSTPTSSWMSGSGRSCYSGVTLFCIIKGDLRLLGPRQCCTIAEVDFGYGDGVTLVNQPLQHLRR